MEQKQSREEKIMTVDELLETDFDTDVTAIEDHDNLGWLFWNEHWAILTA